jgi:deazaflavin-dependent oxidoreductase (nitroreductase family)
MTEQFLYLTTTGHKSGSPHEIEIWFVEFAGRYYLVSEHREKSHWVQNIQHNPEVTFRVGTQIFDGTGRVIHPDGNPELATTIRQLMDTKYNWSIGLIVELTPTDKQGV